MKTKIKPTEVTFSKEDYQELLNQVEELEKELEKAKKQCDIVEKAFKKLADELNSTFQIENWSPEIANGNYSIFVSRDQTDRPRLYFKLK